MKTRDEGWMSIATAHGCIASSRAVEKIEGGWRAIGEIRRISDGVLLAQAEGFVGMDETKTWAQRPEYACRAMAQTRAISRACRAAFAHVVVLMDAGLSTTPAEEVPAGGFDDAETPKQGRKAPTTITPHNTTKSPAQVKPAPRASVQQATPVTRKAMMEWLLASDLSEQEILQYGIDKAIILPNEGLIDWPLNRVGTSKKAWNDLLEAIQKWLAGDGDLGPEDPKSEQEPEPECFSIIVPVPHKGEKRDAYLKNPDTIGSLYRAVKSGDQSAQARLWGFVNHFEPKGWTKRSGEQMPPSDVDVKFRAALDEFLDWHEAQEPGITP